MADGQSISALPGSISHQLARLWGARRQLRCRDTDGAFDLCDPTKAGRLDDCRCTGLPARRSQAL